MAFETPEALQRASRPALLSMTSPPSEGIYVFGTVDLDTTMSDEVRDARQMALVLLMFIGRLARPLVSVRARRERARRCEPP
ncbi:hypothetical protein ACIBAG_14815 [Streptomyces sp. NPDC051243]|uniref:hypothetical protein n=1 Tax=Streptomyces sp. NPDC051243 TaxID=3365646 RepID=UPI00379A15F6